MLKRKVMTLVLAITLMVSAVSCNKKPVSTDPTVGTTSAVKFNAAADRADRVAGYAQIAHDRALPLFAQIVKLPADRLKRDQEAALKIRDLAHDLAPTLRGLATAVTKEGKDKAKAIVEEMAALLTKLEQDGLLLFPETEAGQRLEVIVKTALALLPLAIDMLKNDLR